MISVEGILALWQKPNIYYLDQQLHNILTVMSIFKVLRHVSMYLHHLQGDFSYVVKVKKNQ